MNFTLADLAVAAGRSLRPERRTSTLSGVAVDSRAARPGDLFVAMKGARVDGHEFAADAVARGARAVLGERRPRGAARKVVPSSSASRSGRGPLRSWRSA